MLVVLTPSQWGLQSVPGGPGEAHSSSEIGPHCSLLLELDYGTGLSLLRHPTLGRKQSTGMNGIRQVVYSKLDHILYSGTGANFCDFLGMICFRKNKNHDKMNLAR